MRERPYDGMPLEDAIELLVNNAAADLRWECKLESNVMFHGSAYGPWLPSKLLGLQGIT